MVVSAGIASEIGQETATLPSEAGASSLATALTDTARMTSEPIPIPVTLSRPSQS